MNTMVPPPTGIYGAEQALQNGYRNALAGLDAFAQSPTAGANYTHINANRDQGVGALQGGINQLNSYYNPGVQANNSQAALSGAMGPQAQAQAYASFNASPGQDWLRDQAERSLLRNSAAIGGLGGGNVRQALQQQAMGLAQQDFQNHFNRLGVVGDRGLQAGGMQANLYGQQGNMYSAAGGQGAGVQSSAIGASASRNSALAMLAGKAGDYGFEMGRHMYDGRQRAGELMAQNIGNTSNSLADLVNQQGIGMAQGINQGGNTLAQLLAGMGSNQGQSQQNLAQLLSQNNMTTANIYGGVNGVPGNQYNPGTISNIGNALGGVGTFMGAF